MASATDADLAALSKPELLRVIHRMRGHLIYQLDRSCLLSAQAEEANEKATEALNASIAMTAEVSDAHQAVMAAIHEYGAVAAQGGSKARAAEKKMNAANAAYDAVNAKKNHLFDLYERHNRRAEKLWKQLDEERSNKPDAPYCTEF